MRGIAIALAVLFATTGFLSNASDRGAASPPTTYRIAGVVVDSITDQPLDGAQVTIASLTAPDQERTFLASADGRFLFADLPVGKYHLTAGCRGYASQAFHQHEGFSTAVVTGPGLDSEHIRFQLAPNAVLTGVVTDEFSDPVRNAKVLLFSQSMSDGAKTLRRTSQAVTDDQGRYRFAHLLPGTYAVAVYARPWYTQDENQRAFLEAFTGQVLQGDVQKELQAVSNELQELQKNVQSEDFPNLPVDIIENTGNIETGSLSQIFDVVYPVTFFPNATRLADAARLSLSPDATEIADFQLRTVPSVHLRVNTPVEPPVTVTTEDGGPENTAQVDVPADINITLKIGEDFTDQLQPARTEIAPGISELSGIPPGQLELLATSSINPSEGSYVSRTKTLDVSGDTAVDFSRQTSSASVSGVVLSNLFSSAAASGKSPAPAQSPGEGPLDFTISFRSQQSGESYDTSVSANGAFSFAAGVLPEGSYEVEFLGQPSIQVSSIEAQGANVSGRTVEISAGQPVSLTIHTVEAKSSLSGFALKNGKPIAGAMILLVSQDSVGGKPTYHRDQSDSDGSFSMSPLFPGRYTLLAIENGWDLEWADPAVLFRYLPSGQAIEIPPDSSVKHNARVQ